MVEINQKYEILWDKENEDIFLGKVVHRIIALKEIKDSDGKVIVQKREKGGFVENYHNLSQDGTSWIFDDAVVCDHALVCDDAKIFNEVVLRSHVTVSGLSKLYGETCACGCFEIRDKEIWTPVQITSMEVLNRILNMQYTDSAFKNENNRELKSSLRLDPIEKSKTKS